MGIKGFTKEPDKPKRQPPSDDRRLDHAHRLRELRRIGAITSTLKPRVRNAPPPTDPPADPPADPPPPTDPPADPPTDPPADPPAPVDKPPEKTHPWVRPISRGKGTESA